MASFIQRLASPIARQCTVTLLAPSEISPVEIPVSRLEYWDTETCITSCSRQKLSPSGALLLTCRPFLGRSSGFFLLPICETK